MINFLFKWNSVSLHIYIQNHFQIILKKQWKNTWKFTLKNLEKSWNFLSPKKWEPWNWNLARTWHFEFWLSQNTPPPLKFGQDLALWVLTNPEYPPPPIEFRQDLALWVLTNPEYPHPLPPPENWNLVRTWHIKFWLTQNPPPPPQGRFMEPVCGD